MFTLIFVEEESAGEQGGEQEDWLFMSEKNCPWVLNLFTLRKWRIVRLRLQKNMFNLTNDIYLYIPPRGTTGTTSTSQKWHIIENETSFFAAKGDVLLFGDFNARTLNISELADYDPVIKPRISQDRTVNTFGRHLLYLCIAQNLLIANGRLGKDKDGIFTCSTHTGSSVVDYLLFPYNLINQLSNFEIDTLSPNSDHCPLTFILDVPGIRRSQQNIVILRIIL